MHTDTDDLYVDLTDFILDFFFSQRQVLANAEIKPQAKALRNKCKK
jgi:hypothetical protein